MREAEQVRRAVLEDAKDDALTFLASIAPLQSAITVASDGGARVKIDIPESELRITVEQAQQAQAIPRVRTWKEPRT